MWRSEWPLANMIDLFPKLQTTFNINAHPHPFSSIWEICGQIEIAWREIKVIVVSSKVHIYHLLFVWHTVSLHGKKLLIQCIPIAIRKILIKREKGKQFIDLYLNLPGCIKRMEQKDVNSITSFIWAELLNRNKKPLLYLQIADPFSWSFFLVNILYFSKEFTNPATQ